MSEDPTTTATPEMVSAMEAEAMALQAATVNAIELQSGFVIGMGILVLLMQVGIAMFEAGAVREKNTKGIIVKNIIALAIAGIMWVLFGFLVAFPEKNGVFMMTDSALSADGGMHYQFFFFDFAVSAIPLSVAATSLAGRSVFGANLAFAGFFTLFIYPAVVRWTWGGKGFPFMEDTSYVDYAGSGVVHLTGGAVALAGSAIIGPRTGRFDKNLDMGKTGRPKEFDHNDLGKMSLGTMIIWIASYGLNCGTANGMAMARAANTTTIAAAFGGLSSFFLGLTFDQTEELKLYCTGIIGGLVSIAACAQNVDTSSAAGIGATAGALVFGMKVLYLEQLQYIDEPCSASVTHGICGLWGVMAAALFSLTEVEMGGQLQGGIYIAVYAGGMAALFYGALMKMNLLRLSKEEEEQGLDENYAGGYDMPTEEGMEAKQMEEEKPLVRRRNKAEESTASESEDNASEVQSADSAEQESVGSENTDGSQNADEESAHVASEDENVEAAPEQEQNADEEEEQQDEMKVDVASDSEAEQASEASEEPASPKSPSQAPKSPSQKSGVAEVAAEASEQSQESSDAGSSASEEGVDAEDRV